MTQSPLAALLLSAFERYRAGKPAEAERALREVLARDPEQPLALDLLALLELARGDVTDAMTLLQRALDAEPTAARWALYGHVLAVEPRARRAYLELYRRIDVCLDTLPYNGHTTSLDALWMGVPVVTRVGDTVVGRAGLSQLANLGLAELAAESDDDFVAVAAQLAADAPRLAELRRSLRGRFDASPLRNAERFARNLEAAYRRMWHRWVARG
jgi:tetratricopeptide (TPR) repeat protein